MGSSEAGGRGNSAAVGGREQQRGRERKWRQHRRGREKGQRGGGRRRSQCTSVVRTRSYGFTYFTLIGHRCRILASFDWGMRGRAGAVTHLLTYKSRPSLPAHALLPGWLMLRYVIMRSEGLIIIFVTEQTPPPIGRPLPTSNQ